MLEQLTSATDIRYLIWLLAPTAFLALLAPVLLIAALPQLGVNLLAEWSTAALPMFHYVSAIVPVVIAATIMALARFSARARVVAAGVALGAAVLILAAYPPDPARRPSSSRRRIPPNGARRCAKPSSSSRRPLR